MVRVLESHSPQALRSGSAMAKPIQPEKESGSVTFCLSSFWEMGWANFPATGWERTSSFSAKPKGSASDSPSTFSWERAISREMPLVWVKETAISSLSSSSLSCAESAWASA